MLRKVGRFGGVALANKTFSTAVSDYSNVRSRTGLLLRRPRLSPCAPPRRDALRALMQPRPTRTTHCSPLPARRARVPARRACSLAPSPTWLSQVLGKYLTLEDLQKAAPTQLKTA